MSFTDSEETNNMVVDYILTLLAQAILKKHFKHKENEF